VSALQTTLAAVHVGAALCMPILLVGVVNRTKAWWGGRRGPPLLQLAWDLWRLLHKRPVVSTVATPLFRAGAWVVLAASLVAAQIAPLLGPLAPLQFSHDFIVFAYLLGLARLFLMLSAMDVGSSFEGLGSAREASFTVFIEPALFLLIGSALVGRAGPGELGLAGLLGHWQAAPAYPWLVVPAVAVLLVLLQAEAARVPVDDPLTHLELTMVHEVMVLDHSGPELAAMQYAAALKMSIYAGLIAALLNPFDLRLQPAAAVATALALMVGVAVAVGCVESLMARLRLRLVPTYLMAATALAALSLLVAGGLAGAA
jgi:formate hydrogenlyase subunit 4